MIEQVSDLGIVTDVAEVPVLAADVLVTEGTHLVLSVTATHL